MTDLTATKALLHRQRAAILQAAASYGADDLRLFGSVVRGEDRSDSDIDLLVHLQPGHGLMALARLSLALEALLGRRVDVVTEGGLPPTVRHAVLAEAERL